MAEYVTHTSEWVINLTRELEPFIKTRASPKPRRPILRVGPRLRKSRQEQFEPQYLFLGLYNRSTPDNTNPKTKGNIFRLALVGAFLAESEMSLGDWDYVCARVVEDPIAMLEHYNEEGLDDYSIESLRSVLSLDAIFLACFLSNFLDVGLHSRLQARFPSLVHVVNGGGTTFNEELLCDILMLENQIPLMLIRNALVLLYEIFNEKCGKQGLVQSTDDSEDTIDVQTQADELLQIICTKVATFFRSGLPGAQPDPKFSVKDNLVYKNRCKHLLHCVYLRLVSGESDPTEARAHPASDLLYGYLRGVMKCCCNRDHDPTENGSSQPISDNVPLASASQLRKAGIEFRGQSGLDVRFEKHLFGATLFLPKVIFFGDDCEPIWRNLLAFEDEYELGFQFVSYLDFMDELIDMEEDVALLRGGKHPVFVNIGLGSNGEVARLFNSMTTDYYIARSEQWQGVRRQILDYYNNTSRQTWVEFRRTKFGKPWLFASFLAATALLIMTFLQTIYTILTYQYTV